MRQLKIIHKITDGVVKLRRRPHKSAKKRTRSHQSFRFTKRRDYVRPSGLPAVWRTLYSPLKLMKAHRRLFGLFILTYAATTVVVTGLASQATYQQLAGAAEGMGGAFDMNSVGKAFSVAVAGISGNLFSPGEGSEGMVVALLILFAWLAVIWLARAVMRGEKPQVRDSIYNAGAPLVPTILLFLLLLVQLIPAALGVLLIQIGIASGYIVTGIEGMLLAIPAVLLIALSFYWGVTTFFSAVIVTLPGMYPLVAHRHAHELIRGRRTAFVVRWVSSLLALIALWFVVLIPLILLEQALSSSFEFMSSVPLIPIVIALIGAFSLTYEGVYCYQLYRWVVDHDTK